MSRFTLKCAYCKEDMFICRVSYVEKFIGTAADLGDKLSKCIKCHTAQKVLKRISMVYFALPVCVAKNAGGL